MKNFILPLLAVIAIWFVYEKWGVISCLFFLIWAQFMIIALYTAKKFEKLSEQIEQVDLNTGRLRVRIEMLEANVYGNFEAKRGHDLLMHMDKEIDYTDPDMVKYYQQRKRWRDGFMPPIFNGYFGDRGLKYRLLEIEQKLGIENKSDSEV